MDENMGAALGDRRKKRFPVGNAIGTISITPDGHTQQGAGVIYMTHEVVTDISLSTTEGDAVRSISSTTETALTGTTAAGAITNVTPTTESYISSLTTAHCEYCEEIVVGGTSTTAVQSISLFAGDFVNGTTEDEFVTEVTDETATFLTEASITKTTEEVLMPVVVRDKYGNYVEMVRTEDNTDLLNAYVQGSSATSENIYPIRRVGGPYDTSRLQDLP